MGKIHAPRTLRRWTLACAGCVTVLIHGQAMAAQSSTEAFVGKATTIKGGSAQQVQMSYLSVPILPPVVSAGVVETAQNGRITAAAANWTNDQFNGAQGLHCIHFANGSMVDIADTDGPTRTLTFPGNLPPSVTAGTTFKVRRHLTLSSIFGASNSAGLKGGSNPADADNIVVHNPATQQLVTFFYSTVPGFTGWYRDNFAPANDFVVYPEQGLMIRRKASASVILYLSGQAQTVPTQIPVFPGYNLLGTLKSQRSLRLSELNIVTGDPNTGLAPATNPAQADNLILLNTDGSSSTYFYSNYPGFEGWFDGSFVSAGNVTVPPGAAFFVQRKAPRGTFNWTIPEE